MNSSEPPTPEVLALIEQAVTEDLLVSLGDYAMRTMRGKVWRGFPNGVLPGGQDAQDVVYTAFMRVLRGNRKWNPSQNPDFRYYMESVIDSIISTLVRSSGNRRERELVPSDNESIEACVDRLSAKYDFSTPDTLEENANSDLVIAIIEDVKNEDPILSQILEYMLMEQVFKRELIAKHLSISPSEVTNSFKRLNRRRSNLVEKFGSLITKPI